MSVVMYVLLCHASQLAYVYHREVESFQSVQCSAVQCSSPIDVWVRMWHCYVYI